MESISVKGLADLYINFSSGNLMSFSCHWRSLRKEGGGGNETNGKKAIGLEKQNNNFARASRFFE